MEIMEYKRGTENLRRIFEEYPKGNLKVICPGCKEELLVIISDDDVKKYQRSKGVYCPNGHIQAVFNMR